MEDSKLENALRWGSLAIGLLLLIASIQLSYDGFDQKVSGGNSEYTLLGMAIGYSLAIAFSLLEFIVSSRLDGLNTTLKVLGIVAYVYSIWTNYLGFQAILHMDKSFALIAAIGMDVIPEPMIAWGLGEAVMHDLFGNLGKIATSSPGGRKKGGGGGGNQGGGGGNQQRQQQQSYQGKSNGGGGFPHNSHGGGRDKRAQLEAQYRQKAQSAQADDLSDTGKFHAVHRNFE